MTDRVCTREGCERKHKAKGLCMRHYYEQWITDPVRAAEKKARDRRYAQEHPNQARERGRRYRAKRAAGGERDA